jgi:hypothetical protein
MNLVTGIASQTGDIDQSSEKINTKIVTSQPCHCEAVFAEAVSRFLRKCLFGDCLGPIPMVQDRDLALPETGFGRWRCLN